MGIIFRKMCHAWESDALLPPLRESRVFRPFVFAFFVKIMKRTNVLN